VIKLSHEVRKVLGDKIKSLRDTKGLTQQELADKLKIAQSTIGMIEKNQRPAGRKTLIKLAEFFEVSVDFLLSDQKDGLESDDIKYTLNKKDQKDISKVLEEALEQLEENQSGLMFDGEPIDDETKELLRISLENSMRLAKQIAKNKFTPKKYKK
jgi:transcriptional regulator with XRE-family HTH domain